jgi:Cu2+-exporting ATPase
VASKALAVVNQNLTWALAYNLICVPLAIAGWISPGWASVGMAVSSLVVLANAARVARSGREAIKTLQD